MAKVVCVCGLICSGKTRYARELLAREGGVILSCDELEGILFRRELGDCYDEMMSRVKTYLHQKAAEIACAGMDAILDWGFWTAKERAEVSARYRDAGICCRWHYVDVSPADWEKNIRSRNRAVSAGESDDYILDEGLRQKLLSRFQAPDPAEMDVWYRNRVE